jgi:hypothetical protein
MEKKFDDQFSDFIQSTKALELMTMPAMSSANYENPKDPWEIIPGTPWGDIPQWVASTLATGTMGAFDST